MTTSGRSGASRPRPKRGSTRPTGKKRARLNIIVEDRLWRNDSAAIALVRRAALAALGMAGRRVHETKVVTILLSGAPRLKELNALFRGHNKATNVLSFPGVQENYLGDVAIAYGVAAREARSEGKRFSAHAAHLAAHGVLHLLGYDHEAARDAKIMEALEARILAKLGLADPYAPKRAAA
jgi:probable rRNA maturation factor